MQGKLTCEGAGMSTLRPLPQLAHQDSRGAWQQALFDAAAGGQLQRPQLAAGNACREQREGNASDSQP